MIKSINFLSIKKIKETVNFSLGTIIFFIQPMLWLIIFLFIKQQNHLVTLSHGKIRYVDFLVLGIFAWRMIAELMRSISYSISPEKQALRAIVTKPNGVKILFFSSLSASWVTGILIGAAILIAGKILFDFQTHIGSLILVLFILLLLFISHSGIAFIFLALTTINRGFTNVRYLLTTIFALFSGVFYPVALYPAPFNQLAYVLPFTQGLELLQETMLFNRISVNYTLLFTLIIESILLIVIGYLLYKKRIKKFI